MKADLPATLFRRVSETPPSILFLEQYRIYLQLLDRIADRRQSANSFFLKINTGLCFWLRLVRSYRYLKAAKFRVVEAIEEQLPLAPFTAEWNALRKDSDSRQYIPLTNLEVWIPRSFIILYTAIIHLLIPGRDLFWFSQPH